MLTINIFQAFKIPIQVRLLVLFLFILILLFSNFCCLLRFIGEKLNNFLRVNGLWSLIIFLFLLDILLIVIILWLFVDILVKIKHLLFTIRLKLVKCFKLFFKIVRIHFYSWLFRNIDLYVGIYWFLNKNVQT